MNISRRNFLKNSAILAGSSAVGFQSLFGFSRAFAQDMTGQDDDVQTVLNLAATAELFATTHYLAAINAVEAGDLDLDNTVLDYLKTGFLAERDHYELLVSLGAQPVVTEFYVPETLFSDVALFSQITEVAETTFTAAYLAAARIFTNLGETAFAVTAAQISAVEAEHRALVRQIGQRLANDVSYEKFELNNVSDAVPVLQPFLDGSGEGFIGPVAAPTDEQVAAIRSQAGTLGYMGDVLPFAATEFATASSSPAADFTVTAFGQNVNVRADASINARVISVLPARQSRSIDGQRQGPDGFVWWRLIDGGFIRSDTVSAADGANGLPQV